MKKVLWLLFFIYGFSFGQTYPKDAVELLVGKELKILPSTSDYVIKTGYYNFYKKPDLAFKNRLKADYESLNGAVFKLISYQKNVGSLKTSISLELNNSKFGSIYYEYEPKFESYWIFDVIGGYNIPDNYFCKEIETKNDKFTGLTKYNSPIDEHVFFIKEKGITYIYLLSHSKSLTVGGNGVIILLDDGSKIENKEAKIDVKYDGNGYYDYSTLFVLNDDQIKKLIENQITDYRLYVYDFKIDKAKGWFFKQYLKCLSVM